jgi:fumarate hydratase subunit beta
MGLKSVEEVEMSGKIIKIELPADPEQMRELKLGDEVRLYGTMITGRDMAHKYLMEEKPDEMREILNHNIIYHCGPVVRKVDGEWKFIAAGPTTSIREEVYTADVIREFHTIAAIGKGGMGPRTLKACQEYGAVYFHTVGGAGTLLARRVVKVKDVFKLEEFGTPEAMWLIEVADFPVVVTMDAHGNSLHTLIDKKSASIESIHDLTPAG